MRAQPSTPIDPAVAETVRRLYVRPVDPERTQRDVATIAEAARLADQTRGPVVAAGVASSARRRMPLWRPALAGLAALVAVPGGMATAGVDLPEAFEAPYRAVGISLPNQGEQARSDQPRRDRSLQTPAATAPAVTTPPSTSTAPAAPAARTATPAERRARAAEQRRKQRAAERKRRAAIRRAQRATPAEPATPAQPSGKGGAGATPATPATPARPAQPAGPQEKSATTRPGNGPLPKSTLPRSTRGGKGRGLDRVPAE